MMLPPHVAEALATMERRAREAGYAEGFAAGQLHAREVWQTRLRALLEGEERDTGAGVADVAASGRRPGAEGQTEPCMAAEGGPVYQAPVPQQQPRSGGEATPDGARPPASPEPRVAERRRAWRTEAREALLRSAWPGGMSAKSILREMRKLDGPVMPVAKSAVYAWANDLGLPPRHSIAAGGGAMRATWRTEDRREWLVAHWQDSALSLLDLRRGVCALPGAAVPAGAMTILNWGIRLGLPERDGRPKGRMGAHVACQTATWSQVLAWADTVDPDMKLVGNQAHRLAQVNELRKLEGKPPFVLMQVVA